MFQFPAFASRFSVMSPEPVTGFPIRISADQVVFADPRGFSQLITSFFASGSHRHPPCALFRFPFGLHNGYATPAPISAQARISIIQSFAFFNYARVARCCIKCRSGLYLNSVCVSSMSMCSFLYVENNGFEPLTPCVQGRCSSQLS